MKPLVYKKSRRRSEPREPERHKLHVAKGDTVRVISGEHRGKEGKVLRVHPKEFRVVVEGVNVVKKHVKPNPMKGATGGIVDKTLPIHQSNVAIFNAARGKADRVGVKLLADGKKVRVFRSSGDEIKA